MRLIFIGTTALKTHFFNGFKWLSVNFSQHVSKPNFKWCIFAIYKLSTKLAKDFQRFRVLDLDWWEINILCQLDVSLLDDPQPALVLIVSFITKNLLMSLCLCIFFLGSFINKSMSACFAPFHKAPALLSYSGFWLINAMHHLRSLPVSTGRNTPFFFDNFILLSNAFRWSLAFEFLLVFCISNVSIKWIIFIAMLFSGLPLV